MNGELLAERNLKLQLQKTYISTKQQDDYNNYILQRNKYNSLLRKSKQKYYSDNLNLNINNSKRTWQLLKGIVQPFELGGETRLIRSDVKK
jgi:hypothetical protein